MGSSIGRPSENFFDGNFGKGFATGAFLTAAAIAATTPIVGGQRDNIGQRLSNAAAIMPATPAPRAPQPQTNSQPVDTQRRVSVSNTRVVGGNTKSMKSYKSGKGGRIATDISGVDVYDAGVSGVGKRVSVGKRGGRDFVQGEILTGDSTSLDSRHALTLKERVRSRVGGLEHLRHLSPKQLSMVVEKAVREALRFVPNEERLDVAWVGRREKKVRGEIAGAIKRVFAEKDKAWALKRSGDPKGNVVEDLDIDSLGEFMTYADAEEEEDRDASYAKEMGKMEAEQKANDEAYVDWIEGLNQGAFDSKDVARSGGNAEDLFHSNDVAEMSDEEFGALFEEHFAETGITPDAAAKGMVPDDVSSVKMAPRAEA